MFSIFKYLQLHMQLSSFLDWAHSFLYDLEVTSVPSQTIPSKAGPFFLILKPLANKISWILQAY